MEHLEDAEHQFLATDIALALRNVAPSAARVATPINVIADDQTLVMPDVAVVDPSKLTRKGLGVSPAGLLLVVEITSPSTGRRDLTIKRDLYAEGDAPYIVVDRRTDPQTVTTCGSLPPWAVGVV